MDWILFALFALLCAAVLFATAPDQEWCRRCGHHEISHEHYRAGTDCAATTCTCPAFTRARR